uniref:Bug family tripartite tricarboxylate transporter substrate binding protein n=2 Tax=Desulfovibrio TaxID=872 RepID=UPI0026F1418C
MKKILGLILAVGLMLGALPARAEYPDKAITCIVPFAPGGAADITVRMVADYLSKEIGQPLVIVNKGGGSDIPGLNFGLKARPDGYTVLGGSIGNAFVATYFL